MCSMAPLGPQTPKYVGSFHTNSTHTSVSDKTFIICIIVLFSICIIQTLILVISIMVIVCLSTVPCAGCSECMDDGACKRIQARAVAVMKCFVPYLRNHFDLLHAGSKALDTKKIELLGTGPAIVVSHTTHTCVAQHPKL